MSWGTKEQKGDVLLAGVTGAFNIFNSIAENSLSRKEQVFADGQVTKEEYLQLHDDFEEYKRKVDNVLYDTELGCKLKRTEEVFIMIVKIIMFDLEYDYQEVISNFTKAIDTEEFIKLHDLGVQEREQRLDEEYNVELEVYNEEMAKYNEKIKERKSKGVLSRIFSSEEIVEPKKPERRD